MPKFQLGSLLPPTKSGRCTPWGKNGKRLTKLDKFILIIIYMVIIYLIYNILVGVTLLLVVWARKEKSCTPVLGMRTYREGLRLDDGLMLSGNNRSCSGRRIKCAPKRTWIKILLFCLSLPIYLSPCQWLCVNRLWIQREKKHLFLLLLRHLST